nr:hypothetical protein [Saprospiraceae bacterium]
KIIGVSVSSLMVFTNGDNNNKAIINTLKVLKTPRLLTKKWLYSANFLSRKYIKNAYPTAKAKQKQIYHQGYEKLNVLITR